MNILRSNSLVNIRHKEIVKIIPIFVQYSSEYRDRKPKTNPSGYRTKPDIKEIANDYIGPADKLSNLRPILRHIRKDETPVERELRIKRTEVEQWNQEFWENHNQKFIKEKEAFIQANQNSNSADTLSADKMSEFYKKFLDENWQTHFIYNKEWYRKNFQLLKLAYRTKFQLNRLFKK